MRAASGTISMNSASPGGFCGSTLPGGVTISVTVTPPPPTMVADARIPAIICCIICNMLIPPFLCPKKPQGRASDTGARPYLGLQYLLDDFLGSCGERVHLCGGVRLAVALGHDIDLDLGLGAGGTDDEHRAAFQLVVHHVL